VASDRLHLVRCKLFEQDGVTMAMTAGNQSSGALRSMVLADGLMMFFPEEAPFTAGKRIRVQLLHGNAPLSPHSPYQ
jgi:molybdopterin biosynthesis enzyme